MIPEREREALMRLTMCAREECGMCKYEDTCDFDFQYETATRCMNILADALRTADRKTEPFDKDTNVRSKDEPNCEECKHFNEQALTYMKQCKYYFMECRFEPKGEPQKDCKKCKNYDRCKNNRWKCCVYQPKDEPQTVRSNLEPFRVDEPQTEREGE